MKQVRVVMVVEAPELWTDEQVGIEVEELVNDVIEDTEIEVIEVVDSSETSTERAPQE